jgi:hypothetical protein
VYGFQRKLLYVLWFQFKLDSVFDSVGYVPQFFLLAPSSAPYFDLLNEFLVFKIAILFSSLYVLRALLSSSLCIFLVFKDTFILRFYSICALNCYIFFCVRDDPGLRSIFVVERKDKAESPTKFLRGYTRKKNWSCFEGMKCRKIFFDVEINLSFAMNNREIYVA